MSYSLYFEIQSYVSPNAQLYDAAGSTVGSAITTGIVSHGNNWYGYNATLPDGHIGSMAFYDPANAASRYLFAINPQEAENTDSKTSGVASALSTAHGAGSWATATGFATSSNVTAAQAAILALLPAALVGGKMDSHVADIAANAITAATLAVGAIDEDAFTLALLRAIADRVNGRGAASLESSSAPIEKYSPYHMIMSILNGDASAGTWTPYSSGGTALSGLAVPANTDPNALPIVGTH